MVQTRVSEVKILTSSDVVGLDAEWPPNTFGISILQLDVCRSGQVNRHESTRPAAASPMQAQAQVQRKLLRSMLPREAERKVST